MILAGVTLTLLVSYCTNELSMGYTIGYVFSRGYRVGIGYAIPLSKTVDGNGYVQSTT
jgi:hypothetical protein